MLPDKLTLIFKLLDVYREQFIGCLSLVVWWVFSLYIWIANDLFLNDRVCHRMALLVAFPMRNNYSKRYWPKQTDVSLACRSPMYLERCHGVHHLYFIPLHLELDAVVNLRISIWVQGTNGSLSDEAGYLVTTCGNVAVNEAAFTVFLGSLGWKMYNLTVSLNSSPYGPVSCLFYTFPFFNTLDSNDQALAEDWSLTPVVDLSCRSWTMPSLNYILNV